MVATLSLTQFQQQASRANFVDALMASLRNDGFVVIRDHNISTSLLQQSYDLVEQLFSLPPVVKQRYEINHKGERGYIGFGREKAKDNPHPDLKEFWHIGPEIGANHPYADHYPANVWPKEVAQFQTCLSTLYQRLYVLAEQLLEAIACGLGLNEAFFDDMITHGNTVQRLIHYPAMNTIEAKQGVRAAAHADINLITLLVGATDSGLELLSKQGEWLPVQHREGDIVVDTGDMMALLTNNVLPATVHRVINPEDMTKARYSIPFFVHPKHDYLLRPLSNCGSPLDIEPITAGDFLQQRLRENGFT